MRDAYGRDVYYLRVSVTDRCNLRCAYCRPAKILDPAYHRELLTYEELLRLAGVFKGLGFNRYRITGGEPLVRRGLCSFVRRLRGALPDADLALTTNGLLFAPHARELKEAGIDRVNFSLDTLSEATFKSLTGHDGLGAALSGIEAALSLGFRAVKLNMVVIRGVNEGEILPMVERFLALPVYLRFIEFMPYGDNEWNKSKVFPHDEILEVLRSDHSLRPRERREGGPSRDFEIEGAACKVGVISPLTRTFCQDCNRLRLTSDGRIKGCLFGEDGVDLKETLRSGAADAKLEEQIVAALRSKPEGHGITAESCPPPPGARTMSQVGG